MNSARTAKRKTGRPAKITHAVVAAVAAKVAKGLTVREACLVLGISYDSYETAHKRNPQFELTHEKALAIWLDSAIDTVLAGLPGCAGHKWLISCRFKDRFAQPDVNVVQQSVRNELVLTPDMQKDLAESARRLFGPANQEPIPTGRN